MKIVEQRNIVEASTILSQGGLIAFPTETVFGFGVVFDDEKAYRRLIEVKHRPPEKPFTLMCADVNSIRQYAEVDKRADALIKAFMPGQFTIVLKAKPGLPSWVVGSNGMVGIRVPDYPLVQEMIKNVGKPLLVPSANRSGEKPLTTSKEVYEIFKDEIDAVVEGESVSQKPSTIVIIDKDVKIIREGLINQKQIDYVLEEIK